MVVVVSSFVIVGAALIRGHHSVSGRGHPHAGLTPVVPLGVDLGRRCCCCCYVRCMTMGDGRALVTECVPYLKRQREAEENSE